MEKVKKILRKTPYILLGLIFILGIYLRTKVYLTNQSFWHDECALAWNILNKNYIELFQPMRFLQVAPPMFLIYTKIIIGYFGNAELVFRIVPFVSSLLAMVMFYFLSKTLLYSKKSVLCASLLFAISFPLYYYAGEFKPYSTDVLFCIFTIYIYQYLNKENLFLYSLLLSTFIWFSFPTMFLIGAIALLVGFSRNYTGKEKLKFFVPLSVSWGLFYYYYFQKVFHMQKTGMMNYWNSEFINLDNWLKIFQNANSFIFSPEYILAILMVVGLIIYFYQRSRFALFSVVTLLLVIVASAFHVYPFYGRMILFLIPFAILLASKATDIRHFTSYILLAVFLYGAYPQLENTYKNIAKNNFYKNNSTPREMALYLKTNIKNNDVVYVNQDSNSDYLYYKQIYGINNQEIINNPSMLKKGEHVWFFLPNNAKETFEKHVKGKYNIYYHNVKANSGLLYGIKVK